MLINTLTQESAGPMPRAPDLKSAMVASTFRRAALYLGFNIARHVTKVSRQFFEEFTLSRIGREPADQLAILGFDEQLFQFYPQQIIIHTSALPRGMVAEGPKVNTGLKFKVEPILRGHFGSKHDQEENSV